MVEEEPSQSEFQVLIELYGQKNFNSAFEQIEILLVKFPKSARLRNIQGIFRTELKQFEAAVMSFDNAIRINPDYFQAHNNKGNALKEEGKFEAAEICYTKALQINPEYFEAHANLAKIRQLQGNLEEAIESYEQAVNLKPESFELHLDMAKALTANGQLEVAVQSYRAAIQLNREHSDAHFKSSVILLELGRFEEAEVDLIETISLKPGHYDALLNLGLVQKKLGKLEEAEASYRKVLAIRPNSSEAYNNLGNTLDLQDRLREAEASFMQAIVINPNFVEAYSNLGALLHKLGRLEEAKANYKKAINLYPDSNARHLLAAMTGEAKSTPPPAEYVEKLFDNYASEFEKSLLKKLDYQTPKILTQIILKDSSQNSLGAILDLGCGTGLAGRELKPFCNRLEGVDLSRGMLNKAAEKNIYDKLTKQDILDYLTTATLDFDYIVATDVFNYLGNLSDIFSVIKTRNKTAGKLAFSTEYNDQDLISLEKTGRYSHSKSYIDSLCNQFEFNLRHFDIENLRKENEVYIKGGLYLLEF